jgi:hypothetical protein
MQRERDSLKRTIDELNIEIRLVRILQFITELQTLYEWPVLIFPLGVSAHSVPNIFSCSNCQQQLPETGVLVNSQVKNAFHIRRKVK